VLTSTGLAQPGCAAAGQARESAEGQKKIKKERGEAAPSAKAKGRG
jgi:hypothetical protein